MAVLLDLPTEVLADVAALLPRKDVKSLRTTCKTLSTICSPYVFETIYISAHDINLFVFEMVAAKPQLIKGVKELIVDDTTVSPALLDRQVFRQVATQEGMWPLRKIPYFADDDDQPWDEDGREWTEMPDNELHRLLVNVSARHHENRLSRSDILALNDALPKMTALRTLVLTNRTADDTPTEGAQSRWNTSPLVKLWREFCRRRRERAPLPPRCDWWHPIQDDELDTEDVFHLDYLMDGLERYAPAHSRVEELGSDDEAEPDDHVAHSDGNGQVQELAQDAHNPADHFNPQQPNLLPADRTLRRESRGFQIVIDLLNNPIAQARLVEFRIDASRDTLSSDQQPGIGIRLFDFWPPPFAFRLATGFAGTKFLTKCHLVLANGEDYTDGLRIMSQGQVGSVLAELPRLRELKLEAHNMSLIGAIPSTFKFHDLRRADFACGLVSRLEIRDFLKAHRRTLEEIRLSYCSLDDDDDDPSWADVVADIMRLQRSGKTHLETAVITSAYSSIPFTGCGFNKTKTAPPDDEEVYSWTMGVDNDLVLCATADLGHEPQEL